MITRHRRDAVRAGLGTGDPPGPVAVVQLNRMAAAKCSLRDCTMHFQPPSLCRRPDNGQRAGWPDCAVRGVGCRGALLCARALGRGVAGGGGGPPTDSPSQETSGGVQGPLLNGSSWAVYVYPGLSFCGRSGCALADLRAASTLCRGVCRRVLPTRSKERTGLRRK